MPSDGVPHGEMTWAVLSWLVRLDAADVTNGAARLTPCHLRPLALHLYFHSCRIYRMQHWEHQSAGQGVQCSLQFLVASQAAGRNVSGLLQVSKCSA
jgi:hypothetical protein